MSSLATRRIQQQQSNESSSNNIHNYTLYIYKSGLQLPTMDIQCMTILSYIQLLPNQYQQYINIKFENKYLNIVLQDNETNKFYYGLDDILNTIKANIYELKDSKEANKKDENTTSTKIEFLNNLLDDQVLPCLIHYWYGYQDNYNTIYENYVTSQLTILDSIRLYFIKNSYMKQLKSKLGHKTDEEIYELMDHSLQLLSNLLPNTTDNNQKFLFGNDEPSIHDTKLFAILSSIYYPDFIAKHYRDLFRNYPNLVSYIHNITSKYFTIYVDEEIFKEPTSLGSQSTLVICELLRRLRVKRESQFYHTLYFLGGSFGFMASYFYILHRRK